jgi:hypothetical protein
VRRIAVFSFELSIYVAIVLSVIAAALALAVVRRWGARFRRRVLLVGGWEPALLGLRGSAGPILDLVVAVPGSDEDIPVLSVGCWRRSQGSG